MKKRHKWNIQALKLEALKYNSRHKFAIGSPGAYDAAFDDKIIEDICSHMQVNASKKHTKESAIEKAKKYKNKTEFRNKDYGTYKFLYKNGLLDSACLHMEKLGSYYKRLVYKIEFSDGSIYIGLTFNLNKRINDHKTCGRFKRLFLVNSYTVTNITGLVPIEEARVKEAMLIEFYKNKGINVLNKAKPGGIGGIKRKWTYELVKSLASNEKHRSVFNKKYPSAYMAAIRNGYWKEISSHMEMRSTPRYGKIKSHIIRI